MPAAIAKPHRQRRASTLFLRVPKRAWPKLVAGRISEFRAAPGNVPQLWSVPLPTLVVAYAKGRGDAHESRLMVLEDVRQEALSAITEEGLHRAGYRGARAEAFPRFRRDWTIEQKRPFEPLRKMMVFRVRAVEDADITTAGEALARYLYQDFLNGRR